MKPKSNSGVKTLPPGRGGQIMDIVQSRALRLVLIGRTGAGKSASGNTILGQKKTFKSRFSGSSITKTCQLGTANLAGEEKRRLLVVDTPGFGDTGLSQDKLYDELSKCVALVAPGPHAFLVVVELGRYTEDEDRAVDQVAEIFGEEAVSQHALVLFTGGDKLKRRSVEDFLAKSAPGRHALIQRCGGRYHVFNNKNASDSVQVKELINKVEKMATQTAAGFYQNDIFSKAAAAIREEQERLLGMQRQPGGEDPGDDGGSSSSSRSSSVDSSSSSDSGSSSSSSDSRSSSSSSDSGSSSSSNSRSSSDSRSISSFSMRSSHTRISRSSGRSSSDRRGQPHRSSWSSWLTAALTPKVLQKIRTMVVAVTAGVVVGATMGLAAPVTAALGASLVGNSVSVVAGLLAGEAAAGAATGTVVTALTETTVLGVGAAAGAFVGGLIGVNAASEADSASEAAQNTVEKVVQVGVPVLGMAAVAGGVLGAGVAIHAATEATASVLGNGVNNPPGTNGPMNEVFKMGTAAAAGALVGGGSRLMLRWCRVRRSGQEPGPVNTEEETFVFGWQSG